MSETKETVKNATFDDSDHDNEIDRPEAADTSINGDGVEMTKKKRKSRKSKAKRGIVSLIDSWYNTLTV